MLQDIISSLRRLQAECDRHAHETGDLDHVQARFELEACKGPDGWLDIELLEGIGEGIVQMSTLHLPGRGKVWSSEDWSDDPDEGTAGTYWYVGSHNEPTNPIDLFDEVSQSILLQIEALPQAPSWVPDNLFHSRPSCAGLTWTKALCDLADSKQVPMIFRDGGSMSVGSPSPYEPRPWMTFGDRYQSNRSQRMTDSPPDVMERIQKIANADSKCWFLRPRCFRASVYALDTLIALVQRTESGDAPDRTDAIDDYKPADWFTRNTKVTSARLRQAARPDRKQRSVRTRIIAGVKCYCVLDARRNWPDDMEKRA